MEILSRLEMMTYPGLNSTKIGVFRLDENDALVSGNKFYKLKPWLAKAKAGNSGLLSCGGAYSNHLHALAAAGQKEQVKTAALVRGLEPDNLTVTMQDCRDRGMELIPVSRAEYASRYDSSFAEPYLANFQHKMIWVPEGGTDREAVIACETIGQQLNLLHEKNEFNSVWLAVGSGGTLAGICRSLKESIAIRAVPVMKNYQDIKARLAEFLSPQQMARVCWVENGSYGGFGRYSHQDVKTHLEIESNTGILLDPVYTGKVMRRLLEALQAAEFPDERPVLIHTGGLQGRRSIEKAR